MGYIATLLYPLGFFLYLIGVWDDITQCPYLVKVFQHLVRKKDISGYNKRLRFVTIPELMAFLGAATGGKVPHCYPLRLVKRIAPLFEWIGKVTHSRPLFTRYSLYTLGSNVRFSHDKATTELGYSPMDIKDSIRDTVLYLRGEAAENLLPGA